MKVRIRFARHSRISPKRESFRSAALAIGALLNPAALVAWLLGLWRIGDALNWAGPFAISSGVFSYWQVWLGVAVMLQVCSRVLNRYGSSRNQAAS